MKIIQFIHVMLVVVGLTCVDFDNISTAAESSGTQQDVYRINIGTCDENLSPTESWISIWTDLINVEGKSDSKGCAGSQCHDAAVNSGNWNLGNIPTSTETYLNWLNKKGSSGKTLLTAKSLTDSEIIERLSIVQNPMPKNGQLWFNTDLQRLKRWICQGAENN